MRKMFVVVISFSFCAVVGNAQGGKDGLKVEGSWICTSLRLEDKKLPAEVLEKFMSVFTFSKDGKYSTSVMGKQDEAGTFKIDAKKKPAHLDLMIEEGKDKGKAQLGLIAVEGDVLKLALSKPGEKDRPKDFEGGTGVVIATFKRAK